MAVTISRPRRDPTFARAASLFCEDSSHHHPSRRGVLSVVFRICFESDTQITQCSNLMSLSLDIASLPQDAKGSLVYNLSRRRVSRFFAFGIWQIFITCPDFCPHTIFEAFIVWQSRLRSLHLLSSSFC